MRPGGRPGIIHPMHASAPPSLRSPIWLSVLWFFLGANPHSLPAQSGSNWSRTDGDAAGTRASTLTAISPANVATLKPVWSFATGSVAGHIGSPLVIDSTMILQTPWPTTVYALDLSRDGAPIRWRYVPPQGRSGQPTGCCDGLSGGPAYHQSGVVIVALRSGEVAALDLLTGQERWRISLAGRNEIPPLIGAPFVAGNLVLVGFGAAESEAQGGMAALDIRTGKVAWRRWNTGPDTAVGIAGQANRNYPSHRSPNLGQRSWPDGRTDVGGAVPGPITWDSTLDLIYYGSAAAVPWVDPDRIGDGKWTSTLFARDRKTGAVRWTYQTTPDDRHGYGAASGGQVVDISLAGSKVRALVHFSPNGFAYTLDRATGRVLLAERYGPVNWASHIDPVTRVPVPPTTPARGPICPASVGGKGLQPSAVVPGSSQFLVPVANLCMTVSPPASASARNRLPVGTAMELTIGPGGNGGRLVAWDAATGTIRWEVKERWPILGGVLVTTSGLAVYGTLTGWLKAIDQATGLPLWQFKLPSGVVGSPIAFRGKDGREFLAVVAGIGGWIDGAFGRGTDPFGARPALGPLSDIVAHGGVLMVFGLPD